MTRDRFRVIGVRAAKMVAIEELRVDPALEALVPPLSEVEYEALKAKISEEGFRDPIWMRESDQVIIDGMHRRQVAKELGLTEIPAIVDASIGADEDLRERVITCATARRNLSGWERLQLAAALEDIERERADKRMRAGTKAGDPVAQGPQGSAKGRTREVLAQRVGLSPKQIDRGLRLLREAPQEVLEALKEERITIREAHRKLFEAGDRDHREQGDPVDEGRAAVERPPIDASKPTSPSNKRTGCARGQRPDPDDDEARAVAADTMVEERIRSHRAASDKEPDPSMTPERRADLRLLRNRLEEFLERIARIIKAKHISKDDESYIRGLDVLVMQFDLRAPRLSALDTLLAEPDPSPQPASARKKRPRASAGWFGADYC